MIGEQFSQIYQQPKNKNNQFPKQHKNKQIESIVNCNSKQSQKQNIQQESLQKNQKEKFINQEEYEKLFKQNIELTDSRSKQRNMTHPNLLHNNFSYSRVQNSAISKSPSQQFKVPIIINKDQHNKSKYFKEQYSPLKDNNLKNFFISRNKKQYINQFDHKNKMNSKKNNQDKNMMKINQNHSDFVEFIQNQKIKVLKKQKSNEDDKKNKLFSPKTIKDKYSQQKITNTKFLINILPSQKTKRFFNQSISTFINHNYRPGISYRTEKYKQNLLERYQKQEKQNELVSCDQIAKNNSYKRAINNNKKGKKIRQKTNLDTQYSLKQNYNQKYNEQYLHNNQNHMLHLKSNSHIYTAATNSVNQPNKINQELKLKLSKLNQNNQINLNNYEQQTQYSKRFLKLQKQVMPKVFILIQMGVKIPMKNTKKVNQNNQFLIYR